MAIVIAKRSEVPEDWEVCNWCGIAKPESRFHKRGKGKRRGECDACRNAFLRGRKTVMIWFFKHLMVYGKIAHPEMLEILEEIKDEEES